jgi:hypothetical protein
LILIQKIWVKFVRVKLKRIIPTGNNVIIQAQFPSIDFDIEWVYVIDYDNLKFYIDGYVEYPLFDIPRNWLETLQDECS